MRKLLILALLTISFTQAVSANSVFSFNERTLESVLIQTIEKDDFYTITMSELLEDSSMGTMSAIFYIPKGLLTNGTHQLEVIKPGKIMRSSFYCTNDPKYKFELPSEDRVYVVFQDLSIDDVNDKRFEFNGTVASNGKQGDFTISDLTVTEAGITELLFSFEIKTTNSSYFYSSKNTEGEVSCKESLKNSKVKFGKVLSKTTSSGNSNAGFDPS